MAGDLAAIIEILSQRRDPGGTNVFMPTMVGARERKLGPIADEFRRMGLPWKADALGLEQLPERPSAASVAGRNIGHVFSGGAMERADWGMFDRGWTPDDVREQLFQAGWTEEEAENYIEQVEYEEWLPLKYRRDEALAMDPDWIRMQTGQMTPEQEEAARLRYIGREPEPEPPRVLQGPPGTHFLLDTEVQPGDPYKVPFRPELAAANAIHNVTGEVVGGSVEFITSLMDSQPGMWRRGPQKQEITTRALDPQVQQEIEKSSVELFAEIDNLKFVQSIWDPNYLTIQGNIQNKLVRWMDWFDASTPEQQAWMVRRSMAFAGAASTLNATIKRITGAQMSAQEADRIKLETIDPEKDTPSEFKGKLQRLIYMNGLAIARNQILVEKGIVGAHQKLSGEEWSKLMSFEGVRQDLINKANELATAYEAQGLDPDTASRATEQVMMDRYGVHPAILMDGWMSQNVPLLSEAFHSLPAGEVDASTRLSQQQWEQRPSGQAGGE